MSYRCVLAVDAGSSGCRCVIVDLDGKLVSIASQKWSYDMPAEVAPMGKQFDAQIFWGIICRLISESINKVGLASSDIIAVSTTSQRQGVVFLDRDGQELYAGPNTDIRGIVEGFAIDGEYGSEVYRITGHTPSLIFVPARLRWFKTNHPEIYERIATVLPISDWIIYRLCGERVGEISCVSEAGLVDINELRGSRKLAEMLQFPEGVCPPLEAAGTRVGAVTLKVAERTGLAAGTPVVLGGSDTQCGLLGMGVREEGEVGIVAGWSAAIQMVTSQPIIDSKGRMWSGCHVIPGKWILESNGGESGGAYCWLKKLLFGDSDEPAKTYALMDSLAQDVPAGAGGVLAFIGPSVMDMSRLKVSLGGFIFPVTPSVTSVGKEHLVRGALENLCFAFKGNCAQLEEVSQLEVKKVTIGGGLAQSHCLVQILADALGRSVVSFEMPEVTAWGAAMCAAVGSGTYADLEQAAKAMKPRSRIVEPNLENSQIYTQFYEKWLSTSKLLDDLLAHIT
ncbi:MAG TPA: FGGY-family carbohydrate kinase [Dehalococcoidia bacterium]|nr:FGGY-family carbohydrate kinase [Dehalococcoidia bacterium]